MAQFHIVQRSGKTGHYKFQAVQPGDTRHHATIFNADRQFLSSPERIRTGQRVTIPALSRT